MYPFFKNKDLELAVKSLLKLANESGHYFSNEFWNRLSQVTDKMNLKAEFEFCKGQLEKNVKDESFHTRWDGLYQKLMILVIQVIVEMNRKPMLI